MTECPLLQPSLSYGAGGVEVFPLWVTIEDGRKKLKPVTNWDDQSTTYEDRLRMWFGPNGMYRKASIAGDCDKTGMVVVDLDGEEGITNWAAFRAEHNLGATWVAKTPGGGEHWYYRADPERPVHNSASKLAPGIDIRGARSQPHKTGGFVIMPPSRDDRGAYRWVEGEPDWAQLPVIPTALVDALNGKRVKPRDKAAGGPDRPASRVIGARHAGPRRFTHDEALKFCAPAVADLQQAVEGSRNDRLNTAAKTLSHFVPAFWSQEHAEGVLYAALDPSYPRDEAAATIASAFSSAASDWVAEKREPREKHSAEERITGVDPPQEAGEPRRAVLPGLPDEFWNARPVLQHIRQAAWSRLQTPDVAFYGVLARIAAIVDRRIKVDSGIARPASLNFYAGIVGPSGDGKSKGVEVACDLIPWPQDIDSEGDLPIGSGEGIAEAYMGTVEQPNLDGRKAPDKVHKQVRHNAFFYVDEGEALIQLLERKAAIVGAALRSAWGGETIGQYNATESTRRVIQAGTYSLGFLIGLQPSVVTGLLGGAGTGMPQRFVWSTALDPRIPDDVLEWPGELVFDPSTLRAGGGEGLRGGLRGISSQDEPMHLPHSVKLQLRASALERKRGVPGSQLGELDGQSPLMLVKLAGLIALLDDRRDVIIEDWDLAQVVWDTSCRVRDALLASTAADKARENEARTELILEREERKALNADLLPHTIERVAKNCARWIGDAKEPLDRNDIRKNRVTSRDRPYLDNALAYAVKQGWIDQRPDGTYERARGLNAA